MADWMDSFTTSSSSAPATVEATPTPTQPVSNPDWMDNYTPKPNVNLSVKAAQDIPQDKAAQVLKLSDQTGLPTHIISDNLEDVKAKQAQASVDPSVLKDAPKMAALVGSDPHWAALFMDKDINGMAFVERQLNYLMTSSERSILEMERTYHGLRGVAGLGGPDNTDRVNEIDRQLNTTWAPPAGASPVTQIFGKAAELTPPYAAPLALGAFGGIPGAIGLATAFGGMETANAYLDYKNKIDREGNPIPDDTARRWAVASGAITAALTTLGPEAESVANPAIKMLSRGGLGEMLENPGLRTIVDKLLTSSIPDSMLKTGAFFGGSVWGHIAGGVMANSKGMSPMAILHTIFSPENNAQVLKAAGTGAAVGGTMTAGMGAWNIFTDYSKAYEALNTQAAWGNVGNAMKGMKSFEMAPEQVGKVMERLAGDGNVYIPLQKWQEWAETQKVDPRQAWQQTMGDAQGYDEALKTGADLQMASKRYASQIAPSDHNEFFSKVLRNNPEAMNAEEAEGFLGKQTPEEVEKRNAASKIKEAIAPTPETPETVPQTPAAQEEAATQAPKTTETQPSSGLQPTSQSPQVQPGTSPVSEEFQRNVFPGPSESSMKSITEDPEYRNMRSQAAGIVQKYAQSKGVEATPQFANNLWRNLHDELGKILKGATAADRVAIAKEITAKNPTIENDFATLRDQAWSDQTEGYFQKFVKGGKYATGEEPAGLQVVKPSDEALNAKGKPYALFIGNQEGVGPMYNVFGEHPTLSTGRYNHSTVKQETLDKEGIPVIGKTESAKGEPIQTQQPSPEETQAKQHLDLARQDLGHKPLDLEGMGMTENQIANIRAAEERAHGAAQEEMVRAITDKAARMKSRAWLAERSDVEDQVEKDSWTHPEFVAQEVLSKPMETKQRALELRQQHLTKYEADKQKWDAWQDILKAGVKPAGGLEEEYKSLPSRYRDPEGLGYDEIMQEARKKGLVGPNDDFFKTVRELQKPKKPMEAEEYIPQVLKELEPLKLSRSIIESEYPNADMASLKGMLSDEVGKHPDEVASILGFGSGDEMLQKLSHLPKRDAWVQEETDRRMVANNPDITSDTNLPEAAIRALNNEARGKLLREQLKHLYSEEFAAAKGLTARIAGRIPTTDELKEDVMRDIGQKNFKQLAPAQYLQGMRYAQDEAERSLKAGDLQKLIDSKRAELRNLEMYRAAQKALDTIKKRIAKVERYTKESNQEMLGKAGGTFREDVNQMLNSPAFQDYKAIKYDDLMSYLDQIDSKVHEAREQGKLYAIQAFQKLDDYRSGIIEQIGRDFKLTENELGFPKPRLTNEKPFLPETQASLTRMEFLFDHYDDWKPTGLAKQGFSEPVAQARAHEGELVQKHLFELPEHNLNSLVEKIPFSERAPWYAKLHYIPEIGMSLFKPNMLQVAAYHANAYTWKALLDGYGWTDAQGMAVISRLSKEELDLVDGLSKNFEALRPELFSKRKKFTGIEPEAVQAAPYEVTLKDGSTRKMDGGYTPLSFDHELSVGGGVGDMFEKNWFSAKPSDANLRSRTNPGGRAPSLDFNNNLRVLGKMIHWASFAEPLADAGKIIGDKAIGAHMVAALGKENFDLIRPWMEDIAGNNPLSASPIDRIYNMAKNASMIANLGLKTTSELKHIINFAMTTKELGPQYAGKGLQTFLGNPMNIAKRWEEIKAMDPYMRGWAATWDRDVSDAAKRLNIAGQPSIFGAETLVGRAMSVKDALTHNFVRTLFSMYGYAYMGIGGSAWEGAYMKAMDGEVQGIPAGDEKNAISYAGRIVRTTVAAGNTEDLPKIMRDKGIARLFTWFHGPANLIANNVQKDWQKFSGSDRTPRDIAKFAGAEFLNILPAALIGSALANEAPKAKDKLKDWVKWGTGAVASDLAGMVPILRDIPYALKTHGHQFQDPFLDVLSSPLWMLYDLTKHAEHQTRFTTSEIKNLGMGVGYFTELPSRQVMDSWAVAHDWIATHHYHPDNVASGLWHVATGKEPRR